MEFTYQDFIIILKYHQIIMYIIHLLLLMDLDPFYQMIMLQLNVSLRLLVVLITYILIQIY